MSDDKGKRIPVPLQLELQLDPDIDVKEFNCPWCSGLITIEVDYGASKEDSTD